MLHVARDHNEVMFQRSSRDHAIGNTGRAASELQLCIQCAHLSATALVSGKTRPEKKTVISVSSQASSSVRRFPGARRTIHLRNSPKLTALMNKSSNVCEAIQASTFGSG